MRQRSYSILILASLVLAPLLMAAPEALRVPTHEGVVYTTDQIWSENMTLGENVTISNGATLTIQAGTHLNITEDVTITIEGDLEIQGTAVEPVEIWGSWVAETSIQARWQGFLLEPGSSSDVSHAEISDSRGGFDVEASASLTIESTQLRDTIIGVWAKGSISGDGFTCESATTSCLRVDGTASLTGVTSTLSAEVVHVHNGGNANIVMTTSIDDADVIVLEDGSTFYGEIHADGFTRMVRGSGSVSATVMPTDIGTGGIMVEADSLSGLLLTDTQCGTTCTVNSLITGSIEDVEFRSLYFTCDNHTPCIDAQVDGELKFVGAWPSTEIHSNGTFARLRGAGTVYANELSLHSSGQLFDVSGSGELIIENSSLMFADGGTISGWSFEATNTIFTAQGNGFVILDVDAVFSQIEIYRSFSSSDSTSTGLRAVWSNVIADDVMVTGWNEGIRCESECTITGPHLTSGGGGRNTGSGITIDGGTVIIDTLDTSASDVGINIVAGTLHVAEWNIDMTHRSYGIQLANDASAIIRDMPSDTSSGVYDGFGDGTLLWGSSGTPNFAVSVEEQFTESTVTVTDLVGAAIGSATVQAHGFSEITNPSGESILPLLTSGSYVQAEDSDSGMGSSATLSPPGGEIQIAIVPGTGDWTIPSGVDARLVGGSFVLDGNLTIESTASLMLIDSTLTIPETAILAIQPNGQLKGDNGVLQGGVGALTAGVPLKGEGQGLTISSSLTFTCYDPWTWVQTSLTGSLELNQDCELILDGGHASGTLAIGTDAILTERSHLKVTVIDAGNAVEGANVSVGGAVQQTNSNGEVSTWYTWRVVDENGETNNGNQQTVVIQHANVNRYQSWIPTSNAQIEVMISTVPTASTSESIRLEAVFSPWHLGSDLVVAPGTILEIMPGVELSIAPDAGITVEGILRANDAWIGGTASGGISTGENGSIEMISTLYSGGPITVGNNGIASLASMTISDAPVSVSGSGTLAIIDGSISQTDICVRSTGTLNLHGTLIQNCGMYAIWTTDASLWIDGVIIGAGSSNGAWVQQSSGTLSNWDTTAYDGDGSALFLQMVDESLTVTDMTLSAGTGESALHIEQAENFILSDSTINGSPGVLIEESEMKLLRVDLFGTGSGVGVTVHGTPSAGTIIEDCDVQGYDMALRLEGGLEDADGIGVTILNSHLHAEIAIDSNTLPFTLQGGELGGMIQMLGFDKMWSANVIDIEEVEVNITGAASLHIGHTWAVSSSVNVTIAMTIPEFDFTLGEQQLEWDNPSQIVVIHQTHTESGMTDAWYGQWTATSEGYLPATGQLQLDTSGQRVLSIEMTLNSPPIIIIEGPETLIVNAGQPLNYSATATDPNGDDIVEWVWVLQNGDDTFLIGDTSSGTTTDTEQGEWTLRATAIDIHGAEGYATVSLTVNPADADSDYIDSCPSIGGNAWWDAENNRFCGPDVFDVDDDNDEYKDDIDAFPHDACAHHDTDVDGLPDSIRSNCQTNLIEDDDDDGDGVSDSEDLDPLDPGVGLFTPSSEEKSLITTLCSPSVVLTLGLIIVFSTFAYLRFNTDIRRED
tara:strand:- start:4199 stop:8878 length:4680 start_codon:yes stop_codon:yes gene_type:complete